ncbi:hypothetical protein [Mesorhizobium sp. M0139]|uniref:hypothetical protein n=1 Tax=Mesorhizobium sp. M0139 TaxID=2956892 RepID=UPI00333ACF37
MQLYNCTVRLNGSTLNEVPKFDISAAEIKVLTAVHNGPETGVEVIHSIKATRRVDRSDEDERAYLKRTYEPALLKIESIGSFEKVLGWEGTPLPQTVAGVDSLPPPKTGKRAPKAAEPDGDPDPVEPIDQKEFA